MHWSLIPSKSGIAFYEQARGYQWAQRDSLTRKWVLQGAIPKFLRTFMRIRTQFRDSSGKKYRAVYYVAPDYLSVGSDTNWARVHITPLLAQELADSLHCFLPTRKMVNEIYIAATVKLEPIPLTQYRDSTPTFYQHHLLVEQQRKGKNGLIAGIQKDLVTTGLLNTFPKKDRVAIYGWHRLDGKPIQSLYTGHVNWYVDYSQGVRLIYEKIKVNGKWLHYSTLFSDPVLKNILCDEPDCGNGRYPLPGSKGE
ncbi:MAG: hypothetical protein ACKO41_02455 [Sphingomonadales bacterium]